MISWAGFMFLNPSSYLMEIISSVHDYVMMFVVSVLFLVVFFLSSLLFQKSFNSYFYENHQLESVWTFIPFIVLFIIVVPSLFSLYLLDSCIFCGFPVIISGHQWYWSYMTPFSSEVYDSFMTPASSTNFHLLETDNSLCVPLGIPVRCLLSSTDVIHSWTVPSLGIKMDAIPGRINNFCFSFKRSGIFFGQCSEICGTNHSFMPISVESIFV